MAATRATVDLRLAGWGYTVRPAENNNGHGRGGGSRCRGGSGCALRCAAAEGVRGAQGVSGAAARTRVLRPVASPGLKRATTWWTVEGAPQPGDGRAVELEGSSRPGSDKRTIPLVEFVFGVVSAAAAGRRVDDRRRLVRGERPASPGGCCSGGTPGAASRRLGRKAATGLRGWKRGVIPCRLRATKRPRPCANVALDGRNQVAVDLVLPEKPAPAEGQGRPPPGQGLLASLGARKELGGRFGLWMRSATSRRLQLDESGRATFSGLAGGVGRALCGGGLRAGRRSKSTAWASGRCSSPRLASLSGKRRPRKRGRCRLQRSAGQNRRQAQPVRCASTREKKKSIRFRHVPGRSQGMYSVEFKPLGAGVYRVMPNDLGVWATVA
jgi:hypothetical protein